MTCGYLCVCRLLHVGKSVCGIYGLMVSIEVIVIDFRPVLGRDLFQGPLGDYGSFMRYLVFFPRELLMTRGIQGPREKGRGGSSRAPFIPASLPRLLNMSNPQLVTCALIEVYHHMLILQIGSECTKGQQKLLELHNILQHSVYWYCNTFCTCKVSA